MPPSQRQTIRFELLSGADLAYAGTESGSRGHRQSSQCYGVRGDRRSTPVHQRMRERAYLAPNPMKTAIPWGLVFFCVLSKDKPPTVVKLESGKVSHGNLVEDALHCALDLIEGSAERKHA